MYQDYTAPTVYDQIKGQASLLIHKNITKKLSMARSQAFECEQTSVCDSEMEVRIASFQSQQKSNYLQSNQAWHLQMKSNIISYR